MRLRAYVNNVSLLSGLAQTSASVASPCYLHFTPTTLRLISPAGQYGVQIWATLDVEAVFSNYRIESHHDNEIIIEVSADSLARVLRSASGALEVMLRLGKREKDPLLSWSIVMTSQSGTRLDVMQEIVVRILRQSEYSLISEPLCPKPDVRPKILTTPTRYILSRLLYQRCDLLMIRCAHYHPMSCSPPTITELSNSLSPMTTLSVVPIGPDWSILMYRHTWNKMH